MVSSIFHRLKSGSPQQMLLKTAYPDDVLLIGYPKSGNTWLRFLVGNYLTGGSCDFSNSQEIVPGLEDSAEQCERIPRPRFIHSHFTFEKIVAAYSGQRQCLPKVILIVRDGRDVAVSYYYHLKKHQLIEAEVDFATYLKKLDQGQFYPYLSWGEYNDRWLSNLQQKANNWYLLRYEDLKNDPRLELSRVLVLAGVQPDHSLVEQAVVASSFENMKSLEDKQEMQHSALRDSDKSIRFVRKGRVGQWMTHFDARTLANFQRANGTAMKRLGYA